MESLDGVLSRVVFHKPSRYNPGGEPFLIARLASGVTVKGNLRRPVEGEQYRFWGEMKAQKGGYGDAFEFISYEALCDNSSPDGISSYLAAHVSGIGKVKAAAIVEAFGGDTLTVLRKEPGKALSVPGITDTHVAAIAAHFADNLKFDPEAYAKLIELFAEYRISKKVVEGLLEWRGSSAPETVCENPYILLAFPRVGWKTADAFALGKVDYAIDGPERHQAAVLEALERIAADGHTCTTEVELYNQAEYLLGNSQLRDDAITSLIAEHEVAEYPSDNGTVLQLARLADAEATIADKLAVLSTFDSKLAALSAVDSPLSFDLADPDWITATGLGDDQAEAVRLIEHHPVVIVSGAPGVGKSWTIARVIGRFVANGVKSIRVVAPTGKAAKRAAELLSKVPGCENVPCTTIHRALAPMPSDAPEGVPADQARFGRGRDEFGFGRNEVCPLDEQIVVVDECSMVDVRLMASLLRAIKPGTRVIFVGDHNQLPSVGPGSVLRDMMAAGIPTAVLTQIRRSDGGGTVVRACHAIKDGLVPRDADLIELPTHNWIHLEIEEPHQIAQKIVDLHRSVKTFDPFWGMQVVSPQKAKLPIGCDNLNRLLSVLLNPERESGLPPSGAADADPEGGPPFRPGDKIVRTKNGMVDELVLFEGPDDKTGKSIPDFDWQDTDWVTREIPVVNGDMGQIRDVILEGSKPGVIVEFMDPTRLCRLPLGENHIILAYAMTCHKSQGSGFPYVIVPVHHSFYYDVKTGKGLFTRELLYTMISRAERLLVTVGQHSALVAAVGRKTVHRRKTTLAQRINELSETDRSSHYINEVVSLATARSQAMVEHWNP